MPGDPSSPVWHWIADGLDEEQARQHLRERLAQLDPFLGGPDFGRPGFPTEVKHYRALVDALDGLDPRISEDVRRRLVAYLERVDERWARDQDRAEL